MRIISFIQELFQMCFGIERMRIILTILLFNSTVGLEIENLVSTWQSLGWKSVTLVSSKSNPEICTKIVKLSRKIQISFLNFESDFESADGFVILDKAFNQSLIFQWIETHSKTKDIMLILPSYLHNEFENHFIKINQTMSFYKYTNSELYWILTLKHDHHLIQNKWHLKNGIEFQRNYDLQGAKLHSSTLNWMPYINAFDCDQEMRFCKAFGVNFDIIQVISEIYNFTFYVHMVSLLSYIRSLFIR